MKINYNKNPSILNNFLYYLSGIKGYSLKTISGYNSDLNMFFEFLKEYLNIKVEIKEFNVFILVNVKEVDIIAFLVHSNFNKDNSPNTRQRKLCAIRSFYKWLLSTHPSYEKENPTKNIPNIEKVERIPKYLCLENAKKIQTVFTLENTKFPQRNNAIISLFLSTGIRASELINIDLIDVNFDNSSICINNGKGKKERVVFMNDFCKKQLKKYLEIRNKNKKVINFYEPLFMNYQNNRVGIDCIEGICQKAYKLLGLEDYGYTTHTLRHTAASLMYLYVKQDVLLLKHFLGHASIATTQIYTHIYNQKVKDAVDKNPLNYIEKVEKQVA